MIFEVMPVLLKFTQRFPELFCPDASGLIVLNRDTQSVLLLILAPN